MQMLWENCRAAVRARDWRQLAVAAALIVFGAGMLLRNYLPASFAERGEFVEASVVARTAAGTPQISSGGNIIGSAIVHSTSAKGDASGAGDVVRVLQQALRRAGCYDGPVNGQWSRQSKEAMAKFVAGVNAQLPVERAEPVLLALMEAHPQQTCGSQRTVQTAAPVAAAVAVVPLSAPMAMRVEAASDSRETAAVRKSAAQEKKQPAALPPAPPPVHSSETPPARAAALSGEASRSSEAPREALKFAPFALAASPPPAVGVAAPVAVVPAVPVRTAPAAESAADDEATSRATRSSRSVRRSYMAPRRYIVRHRSRAPSNSFARSVTRNVRSLQRSLGMIVYY